MIDTATQNRTHIFEHLAETSPAILAPLSGITDAAFRELCRLQGCRFIYAEMTSSEALVRNNDKAYRRIRGLDAPVPVVAQLLGNRPEAMAEAAQTCVEQGADAVDINMGCPVKRIVNGGGGSALMKEPALVAELIRTMVARVSKPVTVKIRAGWDYDCRNAVEIAHIAESEGARAIAVHPRTKAQAFKGKANWEVIGKVKEAVSIPVIGNGDIKNRQDLLDMRRQTGCDAVMVGRAALGAPWIFRELEDPDFVPPSFEERIDIAIQHLELLALEKGDYGAVEFRKHLACYLKTMPNNKFVRERMGDIDTVAVGTRILREYRDSLRERRESSLASS